MCLETWKKSNKKVNTKKTKISKRGKAWEETLQLESFLVLNKTKRYHKNANNSKQTECRVKKRGKHQVAQVHPARQTNWRQQIVVQFA